MFVLIAVCCNDLPIASATLMKRFAKSVRRIGSGPPASVFMAAIVSRSLRTELRCAEVHSSEERFLGLTRSKMAVATAMKFRKDISRHYIHK